MKLGNLLLQTLMLTVLLFSHLLCAEAPDQQCPFPVSYEIRPEVQAKWLFDHERELKEKGCWLEHLKLGKTVLAFEGVDQEIADKLSLQMASSAFYLGMYLFCDELASNAYESAVKLKDEGRQIESLYLMSAAARAMQKEPVALSLAQQALALLNKSSSRQPLLSAKVLYNLGAALMDGKHEKVDVLEVSASALVQASQLFFKLDYERDVLRSEMRLAKIDYLKGYNQLAKDKMDTLKPLRDRVNTARTDMQFNHQMAKIMVSMHRWPEASQYASMAQKEAEALLATADIELINSLLEDISQKRLRVE